MIRMIPDRNLVDEFVLRDVVWAALEKISQKQKNSAELSEGGRHHVSLHLEGTVDGHSFAQSIDSVLSIGHAQTKTSSVNPQVPELLAWILSKLNRATRTRLLNDLPQEFAERDRMPESDPELVSATETLLKSLRTCRPVQARGPVRCEYRLS